MLKDGRIFGRKTRYFTLQWHLTNSCELFCKHCYDRNKINFLNYYEAVNVLNDLRHFCEKHKVGGHVCLSGGNPFLFPYFFEIYQVISKMGFHVSILGNPVSETQLSKLVSISKPIYYQVSLEGLAEQNDLIRGNGHYVKVMNFLSLLRKYDIKGNVMLTLTKDNINEVITLGEILKDTVFRFTFNRLSQVGEGADLELPDKKEFIEFLKKYILASRTNPVLFFKENLFNIFRYQNKIPLSGGCTGYGCGAAFNFLALLPDGEVHACRKFPSPVGNILDNGIEAVYSSNESKKYRYGPKKCRFCPIRNNCGGCFAVSYGNGLDVFKERDPYCFMD